MTTYISITTDAEPVREVIEPDECEVEQAADWQGLSLNSLSFGHLTLSVEGVYDGMLPKLFAEMRTLARILDAIAGPAPTT